MMEGSNRGSLALRTKARQPGFPDNTAALTLDEKGMIRDCTGAAESLLGRNRGELTKMQVGRIIPGLRDIPLFGKEGINPRLGFLCRCGHRFLVRGGGGDEFECELHLFDPGNTSSPALRLILDRLDRGSGQ